MSKESNMPKLESLGDVVRWVIEEVGAFCPSPERLAKYRSNPNADDLRDVRYHVEEAGCKLCRYELSQPTHHSRK